MRVTHELKAAVSAARFVYRPSLDHAELATLQTPVLSIRDPSGSKILIADAAMSWDEDTACLSANVDTTDYPPGVNYRADIAFSVSGRSHARMVYFDVLPDPWLPNLTGTDLSGLAPLAALDLDEAPSGYATLIDEAELQLRLKLKARGVAAGLVHNRAALDHCHRLLTLSLVYLRAADGPKSLHWEKHRQWQKQYEQSLWELLSTTEADTDLNGLRDDAIQNAGIVRLTP